MLKNVRLLEVQTRECGYQDDGRLSKVACYGIMQLDEIDFSEDVSERCRKARFELMQKGFLGDVFIAGATLCPTCNVCQPVRINLNKFDFSKRQEKIERRFLESDALYSMRAPIYRSEMYDLFKKYLSNRFPDSPMHDYTEETLQFDILSKSHLLVISNDNNELLGFALIDQYENECSLDYIVYDPDHADLRIGDNAFIAAIRWAQDNGLNQIYLGPTNDTAALKYKSYLNGLETFNGHAWVNHNSKTQTEGPDFKAIIKRFGLPEASKV